MPCLYVSSLDCPLLLYQLYKTLTLSHLHSLLTYCVSDHGLRGIEESSEVRRACEAGLAARHAPFSLRCEDLRLDFNFYACKI